MIKRLRVHNFLSLKDIDLELGTRNVLVGPNMSGKSNLIDCFRFLTTMVISGLNKAFLDRGGFQEVVWKGGDESRISFGLTVEDSFAEKPLKKTYDYEISIVGSTATGLITVEREKLIVKTKNTTKTLIDLKNGQGKINKEDGSPAFPPPGDPSRSALEFDVPGWEGTLVKTFVSTWRFYRLIPALMKQANPATSQTFLNPHGDNFSSWLMTLQSHTEEFRRIKQVATDVLPGLKEILTPPTQFATTYVTTEEKDLKGPINIWRMSDGELCFLALLSLIFAPERLGAPLFCIEEPENHLHPKLLEALVEVLSQRRSELGSNAAQIIVTTHSPYLVDKLGLDDLVVVEKSKGASKFTRPGSKQHLRELLAREELGLGELWYSGALGGS